MRNIALVLEGEAGHSVPAVRSLAQAGWRVLAASGTRAGMSRWVAERVRLPVPVDEPSRFADTVRALVRQHGIDLLVPCTEAAIEIVGRDAELQMVPLLAADPASQETCLDKGRTLRAGEAAGFPTPVWLEPETVDEARRWLAAAGAPIVVKPHRSWHWIRGELFHRRHAIVASQAALDAALAALREPGGRLPLLQEHVDGTDLSVSAVVSRGEVLAAVPVEKLSAWPLHGGKGVWRRTLPLDTLGVAEALDLLRAMRYEGIAQVEYRLDPARGPRLMEINPRLHGYTSLPMAAGADLPALAARVLRGEAPPACRTYVVGLEQRWIGGELRRVGDTLVRPSARRPGERRRDCLRALWPLWRPGMRYDELDDPRDVLAYVPRTLRPLLRPFHPGAR